MTNLFFFVFILILKSPYIRMCRDYYKQDLDLRGALFTDATIQEYSNVVNFPECLNHCKKHYCLSLSVNTATGLCRLYSNIFDNTAEVIFQDGAAYYYQWSDTCLGWRQSCSLRPTDVYDIRRVSKQYEVYNVLCDMDTNGGGWTVMQNRFDGSLSFDRTSKQYENNFGNFSGEFWLGLNAVKTMCYDQPCELRVELEDWQGVRKFAAYSNFRIGWWGERFKLTISGYSGTAGDAMGDLNGIKFSTFDSDEDMSNTTNCAELGQSGWWYSDCGLSNLNGPFTMDNGTEMVNAMTWWTFHGSNRPLKKSRMLFRAKYTN
ncbi:ficolin-3-like [Argopecten irradians]|uniref:ficolin-3-like n=1 Tax=Argopecten irradians TaxID=31199 RepID=UPI003723D9EC